MEMKNFLRINALLWADTVVAWTLFAMQNYLTQVWKLSLTHAAAIMNFRSGISRILPVFFLYLVDSFLGHFKMLLFTSIAYSAGMVLLSMSPPPILADLTHTCKQYEPRCIGHIQEFLLYAGFALIAIGKAGKFASAKPFLIEQGGDETAKNNARRAKLYNALGLTFMLVVVILQRAIPYLKARTLQFGIPTIFTVLATVWFISGSRSYKRKPRNPNGSPLCNVLRVFIAAKLKLSQSYPDDIQRYHRTDKEIFSDTSCLEPLHKAAIILPGEKVTDGERNRWKLCSIAEVEEAKIAVRMVPMWMTFVVCGIVSSAGDTYFVEQAGKMNRKLGKMKLPIMVLLIVRGLTKCSLDYVVGPLLKQIRKDSAPSFGIALGMICSILCCISAAGVEGMRLNRIRRHGLSDKADEDGQMRVYWLLFQFVLLGGVDSFLENSLNAYYRGQSPKSMQAYLESFTHFVSGLGSMSGVLCVYVVGRISELGGRPNWFQHTLNESRLDRYYWTLAALSSVNLLVFVFVATRYRYKKLGGEG